MKLSMITLHACFWAAAICLVVQVPFAQARMVTQIVPTLTVTEEYTDNYFQTGSDTFEEWTTSYELGFSVGFLNKRSKIYLEYDPEYTDYKNQNEMDSLDHNASLSAAFQPTKHTTATADISYDGHDGNNTGQSWEHSASTSVDSQLTKTVKTSLAYDYSNSFDQQLRTGDYKEHQTQNASGGIHKAFGAKDKIGANFSYGTDNYQNSDADEYESYEPSAFLTYWFTQMDGIETNLEYTYKKFDTLAGKDETIAGDIRYIRQITKHLDGYLKYRHYISRGEGGDHVIYHPSVGVDWDTTEDYISRGEDGDHVIYHPSVGIDWDITEDSGVSIGVGILFNDWDNNNEDSKELFWDLDVYKVFNFSPKGSLYITGSSSYEESDDEAASLGFNISYEAGCYLSYMLAKRISSHLFTSYQLQQFKETVDREDYTADIGGGLTWNPLKWLQVSADATHTNFKTDDASREDYEENTISVFVRFIPERPIRPDKVLSRISLEKAIFD